MKHRVCIYGQISPDGSSLPGLEIDTKSPIFSQDFENLDLPKLVTFLNQKKRIHRKKAEKEKEA